MALKAPPYKFIAGVAMCPGGWLVLPARLSGVTVVGEDAFVEKALADVLDYRPKIQFAGINVPMGWYDEPRSPFRECDAEAREFLTWPRMIAVNRVPSRRALYAPREEALQLEPWLTKEDFRRFRWYREAEREMQPFHQRSFFSAQPDLSFQQMNGDVPLKTSPFHRDGQAERMALIRQKLPGIDEIITRPPPKGAGFHYLMQAAALLWTGRRAAGRAVNRLPLDPGWDESGLRMELVR